jgi:hypothetical protein
VGLVLGLFVVGGEALARVLVALVHHLTVRVAERADRRDVNDLADRGVACRAQRVLGAGDVRLVHRRTTILRNPDLVDGCTVDHRIAARHASSQCAPIRQVPFAKLGAQRCQ